MEWFGRMASPSGSSAQSCCGKFDFSISDISRVSPPFCSPQFFRSLDPCVAAVSLESCWSWYLYAKWFSHLILLTLIVSLIYYIIVHEVRLYNKYDIGLLIYITSSNPRTKPPIPWMRVVNYNTHSRNREFCPGVCADTAVSRTVSELW